MTEDKTNERSWLSYANLSDYYERKARFIPGLLSLLFLLPASAIYNNFLDCWIEILMGVVGIGSVLAVGISHLASAAGNHIQKKIWSDWPYDAPTNRWLHPNDNSRSRQQKEIWYAAIKRLTSLNIKAALHSSDEEIKSVINDSVSALRYHLRNSNYAERLRIHNTDYGFARNFTGLRFLWLSFAIVSCISTWVDYLGFNGKALWCIFASALTLFSFLLAYKILPKYVRQKANHYAESFFGAIIEMDRAEMSKK